MFGKEIIEGLIGSVVATVLIDLTRLGYTRLKHAAKKRRST